MGQIWIREFTGGLDTRRLPETTPGGALIHAIDCHINQGGEIEQRAIFEKIYTSPANKSVGLAATENNLVIFGHTSGNPAGMPASMIYQRLQHPLGYAIGKIQDWDLFRGEIVAVASFFVDNRFVFVNGTALSDVNSPGILAGSGFPWSTLTYSQKSYVGSGSNVFASKLKFANDYTGTGTGFIDLSYDVGRAASIRALARYDQNVAIFAEDVVQIRTFSADFDDSVPVQTIPGIGTISPLAVVPFTSGDVLFLHRSGIRSLRARDSGGLAMTTDIGTAINSLVVENYLASDYRAISLASGIIDPHDGRVWIALRDTIYVFSYYPKAKISAWTTYKPGFDVDAMTVFQGKVYLRGGDDIYVYGGQETTLQYSDDVQSEAWLPHLDADKPTTTKHVQGIDVAARGAWEVSMNYEPENDLAVDVLGRVVGTTFTGLRNGSYGAGTHLGLRLKCLAPLSDTEPGRLSTAVIHHDLDDQADS